MPIGDRPETRSPSLMLDATPDLSILSDEDFKAKFGELLTLAQNERRENQLLSYKPVSATALAVHESKARVLGIGGGNGSGKSELALLEIRSERAAREPASFLQARFGNRARSPRIQSARAGNRWGQRQRQERAGAARNRHGRNPRLPRLSQTP